VAITAQPRCTVPGGWLLLNGAGPSRGSVSMVRQIDRNELAGDGAYLRDSSWAQRLRRQHRPKLGRLRLAETSGVDSPDIDRFL